MGTPEKVSPILDLLAPGGKVSRVLLADAYLLCRYMGGSGWKLCVSFWGAGVPMIRICVFWGLYWTPST